MFLVFPVLFFLKRFATCIMLDRGQDSRSVGKVHLSFDPEAFAEDRSSPTAFSKKGAPWEFRRMEW